MTIGRTAPPTRRTHAPGSGSRGAGCGTRSDALAMRPPHRRAQHDPASLVSRRDLGARRRRHGLPRRGRQLWAVRRTSALPRKHPKGARAPEPKRCVLAVERLTAEKRRFSAVRLRFNPDLSRRSIEAGDVPGSTCEAMRTASPGRAHDEEQSRNASRTRRSAIAAAARGEAGQLSTVSGIVPVTVDSCRPPRCADQPTVTGMDRHGREPRATDAAPVPPTNGGDRACEPVAEHSAERIVLGRSEAGCHRVMGDLA